MNDEKPREFWVQPSRDQDMKYNFQPLGPVSEVMPEPGSRMIHVIEYKAYSQLAERLAEAELEIAKWKDEYFNISKFATDYEEKSESLRAQNEVLVKDLEAVRESHKRQCELNDKQWEEKKILIAQNEVFKEACEFYADKVNWTLATAQSCSTMIGPDDHDGVTNTSKYVAGGIARGALHEAERLGKK